MDSAAKSSTRPEDVNYKALVQASLVLRAKYRVSPGTTRIIPSMVGFHWANRGGQPVSSDHVASLASEILQNGFDPNEADNTAILVQESPGSRRIHDYNVNSCSNQEGMLGVVDGQIIIGGSLSSSHLNQLLKNLRGGLSMGIASVEVSPGKTSMAAVQAHDKNLADYCQKGLAWEILSHEINNDEDALRIIQAACNAKNTVSLRAHEMELINAIAKLCVATALTSVEGRVPLEVIKERLVTQYRAYVEDPHFNDLFGFVNNLGGAKGPFLPDLASYFGIYGGDPKAAPINYFPCFCHGFLGCVS